MKKLFTLRGFCFLLFIILSFNLQAQFKPKVSIGISMMADYRYKINPTQQLKIWRHDFGSSLGVQIKIDLTKRISLETGLFNADYGCKSLQKDSVVTLGYHNEILFGTYTSYHFFNLNIPVIVKYKIINKLRFFWDIGACISVNCFYLDKNFYYSKEMFSSGWTGSNKNYCPSRIRTLNLYSKFNTSLNYKIKFMTLGFDADCYVAILDDNFNNYYYGIGAGFSVMFDIDKKKKK